MEKLGDEGWCLLMGINLLKVKAEDKFDTRAKFVIIIIFSVAVGAAAKVYVG